MKSRVSVFYQDLELGEWFYFAICWIKSNPNLKFVEVCDLSVSASREGSQEFPKAIIIIHIRPHCGLRRACARRASASATCGATWKRAWTLARTLARTPTRTTSRRPIVVESTASLRRKRSLKRNSWTPRPKAISRPMEGRRHCTLQPRRRHRPLQPQPLQPLRRHRPLRQHRVSIF